MIEVCMFYSDSLKNNGIRFYELEEKSGQWWCVEIEFSNVKWAIYTYLQICFCFKYQYIKSYGLFQFGYCWEQDVHTDMVHSVWNKIACSWCHGKPKNKLYWILLHHMLIVSVAGSFW